jgi:hypothetical protein
MSQLEIVYWETLIITIVLIINKQTITPAYEVKATASTP